MSVLGSGSKIPHILPIFCFVTLVCEDDELKNAHKVTFTSPSPSFSTPFFCKELGGQGGVPHRRGFVTDPMTINIRILS